MHYSDDLLLQRFLRYVQLDTQSSHESDTFPSTLKQKDLIAMLARELREIGVSSVETDDNGYLYAKIPANVPGTQAPKIAFIAHVDTSPAASGAGVKPLVHRNYDGKDIRLPLCNVVIPVVENPALAKAQGDTIITCSGDTLLGADNKAGVAEIMDFAHYIVAHPKIPHGELRVIFTVDEEVGNGAARINLAKVDADFAYTIDGSELGEIEDENFNADSFVLNVIGKSVHPGTAKNKLVNAIKVAAHFLSLLPKGALSPETTDGREGFVHPTSLEGSEEKARLHMIIRDFALDGLASKRALLASLAEKAQQAYPGSRVETEFRESYRNMKDRIKPEMVEYAVKAMERLGITPIRKAIRGGTDGARLSFMGLPTPNIFTGGYNYHGPTEFAVLSEMRKAVQTMVEIAKIVAE